MTLIRLVSPKFPRLHLHGVGRFIDGRMETEDANLADRVLHLGARYEVAVDPRPAEPFDPAVFRVGIVKSYLAGADAVERRRVLAAEAAGQGRPSLLKLYPDDLPAPAPVAPAGDPGPGDGSGEVLDDASGVAAGDGSGERRPVIEQSPEG